MRRSMSFELIPLDTKIKHTLRRIRKEKAKTRQVNIMADNLDNQKPSRDCAVPIVNDIFSSMQCPTIQVNNFEIKSTIIQMIQTSIKSAIIQMIQTSTQFYGLSTANLYANIANFLEICDTFKQNGVSEDAIYLRLFPFSLRVKAKEWLHSLPMVHQQLTKPEFKPNYGVIILIPRSIQSYFKRVLEDCDSLWTCLKVQKYEGIETDQVGGFSRMFDAVENGMNEIQSTRLVDSID